jgi:acyl-CoA reductase-like NAD-dependent aldehyde dehydrogenase
MRWIPIAVVGVIVFASFAKISSDHRFDRKVEAFKSAYPAWAQMSETERNRAYDRFVANHPELEK